MVRANDFYLSIYFSIRDFHTSTNNYRTCFQLLIPPLLVHVRSDFNELEQVLKLSKVLAKDSSTRAKGFEERDLASRIVRRIAINVARCVSLRSLLRLTYRKRSLDRRLRMVAKGHRVTNDRFARRSVSRDRLDSAEQKVSPIRKSQIELSSQAARHPRSNRDSSARIKGKDRDKRSQVSCGTYSQPLNRVSLQAVCARVSPCSFFFFSTRVLSPLFILSRYYLFRSTHTHTHRERERERERETHTQTDTHIYLFRRSTIQLSRLCRDRSSYRDPVHIAANPTSLQNPVYRA